MQGLSSGPEQLVRGQFADASEQAKYAAVYETRIELIGQRLIVHTPKRQRMIPLG